MTVRGLISSSLRLLGVLASGEDVTASEAQDALASLNGMLDSWSTESLSVYGTTESTMTLATAKNLYTIGPGGDINQPRPIKIENVSVVYQNSPSDVFIPLTEYTLDQWAAIQVIGYQTPVPQVYAFDGQYPLATLRLFPIPQAGTKLRLFTWDALAQFADINATVTMPPGYEKAVRYNLALELAPEYGKEPSSVVVAQAQMAKDNIQRANAQDIILGVDPSLTKRGGYFNWITGDPA